MSALPKPTEPIPSARDLVVAAMRASDRWSDNAAAREQMRQECHEVLPHHRAELIKHFEDQYQ
ncbi:hypothetical protein [Ottowia thiooxydans]|uniref:hypothetical protein n=1 Tax=Ottowia thiooxydans TaxID=219182 RepID=UPI000405131D|nr:hypothetical protein [Ottowia thiooxydans]